MPAVPGNSPDWSPISNSSEFINSSASVALTIPAIPMSGNPPRPIVGNDIVAILASQTVDQFIRTDGQAVSATVTGGFLLAAGDWRIVWGRRALEGIRVIRSAGGGALSVEYYVYRNQP